MQNNKGLAEQRTQLEKRVAELLEQVDTQTAAANGLLGELQRALDEAGALRSALTAAQTLERSTAQRCRHSRSASSQLHVGP